MPSASAITIYLFGFTAFGAGVYNLLNPEKALATLALPNTSAVQPASDAMALAATAMGIYYTLAAYQENCTFFKLTVPMRLLTATIFWKHGSPWQTPGLWEGTGAALTAVAVVWDHYQASVR